MNFHLKVKYQLHKFNLRMSVFAHIIPQSQRLSYLYLVFKKELIVVLFKDFTDWGIYKKNFFLFPENSNGSQREDLLSELKVMKELLSHKHVVQLLACVTKSGEKSSLYYCNNFNPLTPKISLVILLTVCHTVLVTLVWRTWYWINL